MLAPYTAPFCRLFFVLDERDLAVGPCIHYSPLPCACSSSWDNVLLDTTLRFGFGFGLEHGCYATWLCLAFGMFHWNCIMELLV